MALKAPFDAVLFIDLIFGHLTHWVVWVLTSAEREHQFAQRCRFVIQSRVMTWRKSLTLTVGRFLFLWFLW